MKMSPGEHMACVPNTADTAKKVGPPIGSDQEGHPVLGLAQQRPTQLEVPCCSPLLCEVCFNKSPNNFEFGIFEIIGHFFLCPINVTYSILDRACGLRFIDWDPLGMFSLSSQGHYNFLQAFYMQDSSVKLVDKAYVAKSH